MSKKNMDDTIECGRCHNIVDKRLEAAFCPKCGASLLKKPKLHGSSDDPSLSVLDGVQDSLTSNLHVGGGDGHVSTSSEVNVSQQPTYNAESEPQSLPTNLSSPNLSQQQFASSPIHMMSQFMQQMTTEQKEWMLMQMMQQFAMLQGVPGMPQSQSGMYHSMPVYQGIPMQGSAVPIPPGMYPPVQHQTHMQVPLHQQPGRSAAYQSLQDQSLPVNQDASKEMQVPPPSIQQQPIIVPPGQNQQQVKPNAAPAEADKTRTLESDTQPMHQSETQLLLSHQHTEHPARVENMNETPAEHPATTGNTNQASAEHPARVKDQITSGKHPAAVEDTNQASADHQHEELPVTFDNTERASSKEHPATVEDTGQAQAESSSTAENTNQALAEPSSTAENTNQAQAETSSTAENTNQALAESSSTAENTNQAQAESSSTAENTNQAQAESSSTAENTNQAQAETSSTAENTNQALAEPSSTAENTNQALAELSSTAENTNQAQAESSSTAENTNQAQAEASSAAENTNQAPAEPSSTVENTNQAQAESSSTAENTNQAQSEPSSAAENTNPAPAEPSSTVENANQAPNTELLDVSQQQQLVSKAIQEKTSAQPDVTHQVSTATEMQGAEIPTHVVGTQAKDGLTPNQVPTSDLGSKVQKPNSAARSPENNETPVSKTGQESSGDTKQDSLQEVSTIREAVEVENESKQKSCPEQKTMTTTPQQEIMDPLLLQPSKKLSGMFNWKLACSSCIFRHGTNTNDYTVDSKKVSNNHAKNSCKKTILCCRFNDGKEDPWRIVRKRPETIRVRLCPEASSGKLCENPGTCPFAYCTEEHNFWVSEAYKQFERAKYPSLDDVEAVMIFQPNKSTTEGSSTEQKTEKLKSDANSQTKTKVSSFRVEANLEVGNTESNEDNNKVDDAMDVDAVDSGKDSDESLQSGVGNGEKLALPTPKSENKQNGISTKSSDNPMDGDDNSGKNNQGVDVGTWYKKDETTVTDEQNKTKGKKGKQRNKKNDQKKDKDKEDKKGPGASNVNVAQPAAFSQTEEETMQVNFFVWVSPDFGYDPSKHTVIIKSGLFAFGGWEYSKPCVTMKPTGVEVNGLIQVMGSLITPPRHLKYIDMDYKYVVLKKGLYNWEFIPDDSPYKNRWMKIQKDYYVPGGIWNRYDDVIYPKPDMWNKIKSTLWDKFRKQALKNKIIVTKKMLPTLEEFSIGKKNKNLGMDTIQQVKQVFMSVDENWNPGFDSKRFMLEYLEPVFKSYRTTKVTDGRLVSALSVLYLLRHLDMMQQLKYCQVGDLFEGLLIQPDLEKKTIPSIDEMHQHFPQKEDKSYLVAAMEHFCNHTFQDADSLDPRFLLCTPVLHYLRENSVPFKPVSDEGDPLLMSWWGANQLKLGDFRDRVKNKYEMLPLVRRLAPIFEADQMLLRTCLLSIPLNEINNVVKSGLIPTYAVCYRLVVIVASLAKYDISSIWREDRECVKKNNCNSYFTCRKKD
ncbi:uncharacterized protein LOC102802669 [Saccoglossus kowalevskii]